MHQQQQQQSSDYEETESRLGDVGENPETSSADDHDNNIINNNNIENNGNKCNDNDDNDNKDDIDVTGDVKPEHATNCDIASSPASVEITVVDTFVMPSSSCSSKCYGTILKGTGMATVTNRSTKTSESKDERIIEIINEQPQESYEGFQEHNLNHISPSTTNTTTTATDSRPLKKRFMQMSVVPRIRPLHNQPSAFVEPLKPTIFSGDEHFQQAMNQWEWAQMDGLNMPVIFRDTDRYAAVHIVQLKLLSKFPPNIPIDMTSKFMMISHKMTPIEAWIFNTVNAVICKFDLGCQLFTSNDEIVRLADVERFYWSVKALNLRRMIETYNAELRTATSTHLMAAITNMRNHVESHLKEVEKGLLQAQTNATTNTATNFIPQGPVRWNFCFPENNSNREAEGRLGQEKRSNRN